MSDANQNFRREMLRYGVISHREQDTLWSIAKKCAVTTGIPMGAAGFLMGASGGTVAVPGIGTVSVGLVGFLGGLATGTAMCTAVNLGLKEELRNLLD